MTLEKIEEKEFIIPTRCKDQIGSFLSWPAGAAELTKALLAVPQINELEIRFSVRRSQNPRGQQSIYFPIIEATFSRDRKTPVLFRNSIWSLRIYAVPRTDRSEIREALLPNGLGSIADWFIKHVQLANTEGYLNFRGMWNSELKELSFDSHANMLPEIAAGRHKK